MKKRNKKSVGYRAEVSKNQNQDEGSDEAYRQINSTSFKHNFKILIGHYKRIGENADAAHAFSNLTRG